jgi:hypothetical protein
MPNSQYYRDLQEAVEGVREENPRLRILMLIDGIYRCVVRTQRCVRFGALESYRSPLPFIDSRSQCAEFIEAPEGPEFQGASTCPSCLEGICLSCNTLYHESG